MHNESRAITYRQDHTPEPADVARLFDAAGLKRPTRDLPRIARMLAGADLIISAWDGPTLVGISRALTDFCYCCYLSDLAVDGAYQKEGIGRELVRLTREAIGEEAALILLSAPGAMEYYPKLGFTRADNAFLIPRAR